MLKTGLFLVALAVGASAPPPAIRTHHVEIQSFAFVPARIEVKVGDVVEWTNRDFAPHTVTSDKGKWGRKDMKNGSTVSFTAVTSGTVTYHCNYHPQMTGTIVIKAK
jgi:plastocyanin